MSTHHYLTTVVCLLGACITDTDAPEIDTTTITTTIQQPSMTAEEAAREARDLFRGLVARLELRGHTIADAQAAAEAGDEEWVRELFGYTDAEFEAIGRRLAALAQTFEHLPPAENPEGIRCDWGQGAACAFGLLSNSWAFRLSGVSWPLVVGHAVASVGICGWANCRWERSGSGPGTQPRKK